MTGRRILAALAAAGALVGIAATAALAGPGNDKTNPSGFTTNVQAMLTPVLPGTDVRPMISVGDTLPNGFRLESILDGISLQARGNGRLDLYVNHETSLVPFPVKSATVPTTRHDYTNALVSHLILNQHSAGVLQGSYVIPNSANYQRFCSNFMAGEEHGFERDLLFTNEEAQDYVARTGTAWPVAAGNPSREQAGVVVAYDVKSGDHRTILGMGRHNHENSVAIPGYGSPVVMSGDDTFTTSASNPPNSQLYMYRADNASDVWNDEGTLYAFALDSTTISNYLQFPSPNPSPPLTGKFIEVPSEIARGKDAGDQHELTVAGDFPTWTTDPLPTASGTPDGPQWVLDQWGNAANNDHERNVFDFIRIEDIAYDRADSNVVYLADSGRGSGAAPNGRIWKMVLDEHDPTVVASLSVLVEGGTTINSAQLHQPDNLETTAAGKLLIQEDPSSGNTYAPPAGTGKTTARIWMYDLVNGGSLVEVANVSQALDTTGARLGSWESSGIVDASAVWGPGWFLVDVQAPSLSLDQQVLTPDGDDADSLPEAIVEREGGQLLRMYVPGA